MKRLLYIVCMFILFLLMLIFPSQIFQGANQGLLLWFQIVIPTLLPFIILSNLFINTNFIFILSRLCGPFICKIFGTSKNAVFAIIAGFFCGYPVGAKITGDLVTKQYVSAKEGRYLLSFCNNTSPMFISSYLLLQNLSFVKNNIMILFLLILSPILSSFIFRLFYKTEIKSCPIQNKAFTFNFQIVDESIMNAFEVITKIGGYIMIFSVTISLARLLPFENQIWNMFILPSLEITNGIPAICNTQLSDSIKLLLVLPLTSFGGFCAIAQTKCMLYNTNISIYPYILQKLVTAGVTSLLTLVYLYIV